MKKADDAVSFVGDTLHLRYFLWWLIVLLPYKNRIETATYIPSQRHHPYQSINTNINIQRRLRGQRQHEEESSIASRATTAFTNNGTLRLQPNL